MTVWTIQNKEVLDLLNDTGTLYADDVRLDRNAQVPQQYEWLSLQIKNQMPSYTGHRLWWFYRSKPDLRAFRHTLPLDEYYVRLELAIDDKRVLCFPSWAWDRIMRFDCLYPNKQAYRQFWRDSRRAHLEPDENFDEYYTRVCSTWPYLFSPDVPRHDPLPNPGNFGDKCECVCECLERDRVTRVTCFTGASRLWKQHFDRRRVSGV